MYFCVVSEWAFDGDEGGKVLAIEQSEDAAKKEFSKQVEKEREFVEENGWHTYVDEEDSFDAGAEGFYQGSHTCLFIQRVG